MSNKNIVGILFLISALLFLTCCSISALFPMAGIFTWIDDPAMWARDDSTALAMFSICTSLLCVLTLVFSGFAFYFLTSKDKTK